MKRNRSVGEFRIFCNLGYDLVENEVEAYFQGLCSEAWVQDVYIPRHSSGRNKGYCVVTFQSEADLLTALKVQLSSDSDGVQPVRRCWLCARLWQIFTRRRYAAAGARHQRHHVGDQTRGATTGAPAALSDGKILELRPMPFRSTWSARSC